MAGGSEFGGPGGESGEGRVDTAPVDQVLELKLSLRRVVEDTKSEGWIFLRQPPAKGGNFVKKYAVLANGRLEFFRNDQDFMNHKNPVSKKPIKLYQYRLETDTKRFSRDVVNLSSALLAGVLGHRDFSLQDIYSSPDNLEKAFEVSFIYLCMYICG